MDKLNEDAAITIATDGVRNYGFAFLFSKPPKTLMELSSKTNVHKWKHQPKKKKTMR